MTKLAIVTPTFGPDFEYFRDLHASVLRHAPNDVVHHAIVPPGDVALFCSLNSVRLKVYKTSDFLPRWFVSAGAIAAPLRCLPKSGSSFLSRIHSAARGELFVNMRRPWPPIRGWILQQIVKLSAVGAMEADVVLLADSDVVFIRPLHASEFLRGGAVRFYCLPDGVTEALPRHMAWHESARRLLGLPPLPPGARPDYITSFVAWDPAIVRRIQERIAATSGLDWASAIAAEIDVSEWTIYGSYVNYLGSDKDRSFTTSTTLCHSHWGNTPLASSNAEIFAGSIGPNDVAVLIQSKSSTPLNIRRQIVEAVQQRARRRLEKPQHRAIEP
jgi:hypothetical protein